MKLLSQPLLVKQFCSCSGLPHKLFFKVGEMLLMLKKAYTACLLTLIFLPNYHNVLSILYAYLHEAAVSKRFITTHATWATDGLFELSLNIFSFSHVSRACDPHPACASQLLSIHSLAALQLGSIQYACCWQPLLVCFSVRTRCNWRLVEWGSEDNIQYTFLRFSVLLHLSLRCARTRAYGLLDRCLDELWQLEKVFTFPKCWWGLSVEKIMLNC